MSTTSDKAQLNQVAVKIDSECKKEAKQTKIRGILESLKNLDISFKSPYGFLEYLEESGTIDSINSILSIISKYKEQDYEVIPADANNDLMVLSSHLIYIGTKLGEVQGKVSNLENIKKLTRSKYIVEAKSDAELREVKLTDGEADNISRVLSEDKYHELGLFMIVQGYLTNLMFNTKFFCETLEKIVNRTSREHNA